MVYIENSNCVSRQLHNCNFPIVWTETTFLVTPSNDCNTHHCLKNILEQIPSFPYPFALKHRILYLFLETVSVGCQIDVMIPVFPKSDVTTPTVTKLDVTTPIFRYNNVAIHKTPRNNTAILGNRCDHTLIMKN